MNTHFIKLFLGFTLLIGLGILGLIFAEKITGTENSTASISTR